MYRTRVRRVHDVLADAVRRESRARRAPNAEAGSSFACVGAGPLGGSRGKNGTLLIDVATNIV